MTISLKTMKAYVGIGHTHVCFYFPPDVLPHDLRWDVDFHYDDLSFILTPGKKCKSRQTTMGGLHDEIGFIRGSLGSLHHIAGKTLKKTAITVYFLTETTMKIKLPPIDTWQPAAARGRFNPLRQAKNWNQTLVSEAPEPTAQEEKQAELEKSLLPTTSSVFHVLPELQHAQKVINEAKAKFPDMLYLTFNQGRLVINIQLTDD